MRKVARVGPLVKNRQIRLIRRTQFSEPTGYLGPRLELCLTKSALMPEVSYLPCKAGGSDSGSRGLMGVAMSVMASSSEQPEEKPARRAARELMNEEFLDARVDEGALP
jgi:hypothetical protein